MTYEEDSLEGRFLAGDPAVHSQVARWISRILTQPRYRLVRRQWGDLHQEVLKRIVESLRQGRFDRSRDFRIYCQSITRYTARDAVVHRIRELEQRYPELVDVPSPTASPDVAVARRTADQLLGQLSENCRALFRLYFYEEASYEEIAKRQGIPLGTVKSRLFRCLKKARETAAGNPTSPDTKVRS